MNKKKAFCIHIYKQSNNLITGCQYGGIRLDVLIRFDIYFEHWAFVVYGF